MSIKLDEIKKKHPEWEIYNASPCKVNHFIMPNCTDAYPKEYDEELVRLTENDYMNLLEYSNGSKIKYTHNEVQLNQIFLDMYHLKYGKGDVQNDTED